MRKLVLLASVALLVFALKYIDQTGTVDRLYGKVSLPFKAAMLSAKEPDRALTVPVEGVRANKVKSSWHAPRSGGRLHEGQDIFAKLGTAVRSATDGYVMRVGESPLGGKTVSVLGAGRRSYYYAHLDSYAEGIAVGDYVTRGRVLGYVGTTGNAAGTSPHLHFGVYTLDGPIDPLPLLTNSKISD
jgi:peptidoglycan LD-endopeptidase LytH